MKTYLVISYVIVSCIFFSPDILLADEATERALAADNKMLRAVIDNLQAEIAKLKTELKQLKEPPKKSKPVDSNSNTTVASTDTQPTSVEGNDVFAKAVLKYNKAVEVSTATTSQRQEAYDIFCKEASVPIIITCEVSDITIQNDTTALVTVTPGIVKTSVKTEYPIRIYAGSKPDYSSLFPITISREKASQIDKGSKFIITGVYGLRTPPIVQYNSLERMQFEYNKQHEEIAIKKGVITLNGQRVELAK